MSTLRIKLPQWQGGVNPNYVFESELLAAIAPPCREEIVSIPVACNFDDPIYQLDGIDYGEELWQQMKETWKALEDRNPDRVIVFGGDCAVTQVPFDYLSGEYGDKLGILWFDAYPDCSRPVDSTHFHEMVMGNLIGLNPGYKLIEAKNPCKSTQVFLVDLVEEDLHPKDMADQEENILSASPEELSINSEKILSWMEKNGLARIAVHWDLDVLSEHDFRSIYPAS